MNRLSLSLFAFLSVLLAGCSTPPVAPPTHCYDLNRPGVRIGAIGDCDSEWLSRKIFNKAEIVQIDTVERGCMKLLAERIDAFVYDEHILRLITWHYPDRFQLLEPALDDEPSVIAVSEDLPALRDELNHFIRTLHEEGIYDDMFLRWCHDPEREVDGGRDMPDIPDPESPTRVLRVGTDCEEIPHSFFDADGNPSGFDVEFIRRFARYGNYRVELVIKPMTDLLADVSCGELDCVVANLDKRPNARGILWTDPYMECDVVMMIKIPDQL